MQRAILLLALLMGAACTPQNGETPNSGPVPDQARGDTVAVRGTVAVVGSAPMNVAVVLRDGNGQGPRVDGPLAEEIGRLSGAQVEVTGTRRADPMYGQSIHATGYRISAVDGAAVITGVVERGADGQLQLRGDDGQIHRLSGGTTQLRAGQRVWVQGPATVQVQSFGVIRP